MNLVLRRMSPVEDRREILQLLVRQFGEGQETIFDWRHVGNPIGQAWSWMLYDKTNTPVGLTSLFPRRMYVAGKAVLAGQVGGFAVEASHRSLGPAVALQRATFQPVDSGELAFCYDCPPHDQGMSTFVRLGMKANCEVLRYAMLLRSDEYLGKRFGSSFWTAPVRLAANLLLKGKRSKLAPTGIEVGEFKGLFGDEFSRLDERLSDSTSIRASRSAAEMNWRFRDHPGFQSYVFVARRAGELLGYIAFRSIEQRAHIVDIFGLDLAAIGPVLLNAAVEACQSLKLSSLHGFCSEQSELSGVFMHNGFKRRERDSRVVAYESPQSGGHRLLTNQLRWTFSFVEESF